MTEKNLIVDGLELNYSGPFDLNHLLKMIDRYSAERGYAKGEKRREEKITPSGKEFSMELRHARSPMEYYKLIIKMRLHITDLKEDEVVADGKNKKLNHGNITVIFDAWIYSDIEWTWQQKPWYVFVRALVERGIKKFHTGKYEDELVEDCRYIYDNLKSYLNLCKF